MRSVQKQPKEEEEKARGPKRARPVEGERICTSDRWLQGTPENANLNPTSKIPQPPPVFDIFYTTTGLEETFCERYSIS